MRDKAYDGGRNSVAGHRSALCRAQRLCYLSQPRTFAGNHNAAFIRESRGRLGRRDYLNSTRCVSRLGYSSTQLPRAAALPRVRYINFGHIPPASCVPLRPAMGAVFPTGRASPCERAQRPCPNRSAQRRLWPTRRARRRSQRGIRAHRRPAGPRETLGSSGRSKNRMEQGRGGWRGTCVRSRGRTPGGDAGIGACIV